MSLVFLTRMSDMGITFSEEGRFCDCNFHKELTPVKEDVIDNKTRATTAAPSFSTIAILNNINVRTTQRAGRISTGPGNFIVGGGSSSLDSSIPGGLTLRILILWTVFGGSISKS